MTDHAHSKEDLDWDMIPLFRHLRDEHGSSVSPAGSTLGDLQAIHGASHGSSSDGTERPEDTLRRYAQELFSLEEGVRELLGSEAFGKYQMDYLQSSSGQEAGWLARMVLGLLRDWQPAEAEIRTVTLHVAEYEWTFNGDNVIQFAEVVAAEKGLVIIGEPSCENDKEPGQVVLVWNARRHPDGKLAAIGVINRRNAERQEKEATVFRYPVSKEFWDACPPERREEVCGWLARWLCHRNKVLIHGPRSEAEVEIPVPAYPATVELEWQVRPMTRGITLSPL